MDFDYARVENRKGAVSEWIRINRLFVVGGWSGARGEVWGWGVVVGPESGDDVEDGGEEGEVFMGGLCRGETLLVRTLEPSSFQAGFGPM